MPWDVVGALDRPAQHACDRPHEIGIPAKVHRVNKDRLEAVAGTERLKHPLKCLYDRFVAIRNLPA